MKNCNKCKKLVSEKELFGGYCRECVVKSGEDYQEQEEKRNAGHYLHDVVENSKPTTQEEIDSFRDYLKRDIKLTKERLDRKNKNQVSIEEENYEKSKAYLMFLFSEHNDETSVTTGGLSHISVGIRDEALRLLDAWFDKYDYWAGVGGYQIMTKEKFLETAKTTKCHVIETKEIGGKTLCLVDMTDSGNQDE